MRYHKINNKLFINNRKRFLDKIPDHAIAIFTSNEIMPTNADGSMGFVQNSAFFYLTGIDQPDSYLILTKKNERIKATLFITETNEMLRVWEGEKLNPNQASDISGIETIKYTTDFWASVENRLPDFDRIYLHYDEQVGKIPAFKSKEKTLIEALKEKFPLHNFQRAAPILDDLRQIKQTEEIELTKKAIAITHIGFERAAQSLAPNKREFEIEAEISYAFTMNRSRMHAFQPIIAAGKNACVLHYVTNNEVCQSGELLLMDFGAEYANYRADMTRTLPINGVFSKRQKQVYEAVLRVLKATRNLMVPGNNLEQLKKQAQELMGQELIQLGLISPKNLCAEQIHKYFPHGVSHFLGLDVHDVGDKSRIFEAGMLLTCEPGIYIREENLGIRLENDILITEHGPLDLMQNIPIEIEEIETLMQKKI
jgi:Xaa-Pro aminopeptidase